VPIAAVLAAVLLAGAGLPAAAQDAGAVAKLEARIAALEKEVRELKAKVEALGGGAAAASPAPAAPAPDAGPAALPVPVPPSDGSGKMSDDEFVRRTAKEVKFQALSKQGVNDRYKGQYVEAQVRRWGEVPKAAVEEYSARQLIALDPNMRLVLLEVSLWALSKRGAVFPAAWVEDESKRRFEQLGTRIMLGKTPVYDADRYIVEPMLAVTLRRGMVGDRIRPTRRAAFEEEVRGGLAFQFPPDLKGLALFIDSTAEIEERGIGAGGVSPGLRTKQIPEKIRISLGELKMKQ
jgi:outer membrane murein-binding lipoprotein Lpp